MISMASGGTADRIVERSLFKVLRASSGTPAIYSSTFFGATLTFATERRLADFAFFMRAMLQDLPLPVHAPDERTYEIAGSKSLSGRRLTPGKVHFKRAKWNAVRQSALRVSSRTGFPVLALHLLVC